MFAKLPPSLSVPLFYAVLIILFVFRFFTKSTFGILTFSLIIYFNSDHLFSVKPYSIDELIGWLSQQSESTKTALLSSLITIIGFMFAYATATANWKGQLLANLKLQAAGELDVFFSEYSKLATDCGLYAESLVNAIDKIQKGCPPNEASFLAQFNRDQGNVFIQKRQRLIAMGIDVHALNGKYSNLMLSAPGLKSSLDSAIKAVSSINEKLWINIPFHIQNDQNPIQTFLNQVNVAECMSLKDTVDSHFGELNFSSGSVRGNLMSTVVDFNLWTIINLYKDRKNFYAAIKERYIQLKRNS